MSSPRSLPSLSEAAAALKYTEDETKKFTKTAITFIVAGVAFVLYSIAAWISGPAPLTPAMAELDEVAAGEAYRAGGISLLLEDAYLEPGLLGDEVKMRFEVEITNHGTTPLAPWGPTRPVYFSGLSWTVE
nr:hypothetical protein [Actinomycetales bacterium]